MYLGITSDSRSTWGFLSTKGRFLGFMWKLRRVDEGFCSLFEMCRKIFICDLILRKFWEIFRVVFVFCGVENNCRMTFVRLKDNDPCIFTRVFDTSSFRWSHIVEEQFSCFKNGDYVLIIFQLSHRNVWDRSSDLRDYNLNLLINTLQHILKRKQKVLKRNQKIYHFMIIYGLPKVQNSDKLLQPIVRISGYPT